MTETLIRHFLAPLGQCRTCDLEEYIQRSDGSRAYFDALHGITDVLRARDEDIPRPSLSVGPRLLPVAGSDLR